MREPHAPIEQAPTGLAKRPCRVGAAQRPHLRIGAASRGRV